MSLASRLAAVDRFQKSRGFQIGATVAVAVLAIAFIGWYTVSVTSGTALETGASATDNEVLDNILNRAGSPVLVAVGVSALAAIAIVAVWLGLGLTYLALGILAAGVGVPLALYEPTAVWGRLLLGVVALAASFTALIQLARLALAGPGSVRAIARNVLAEAVRMRVSVVFIVLLILGLALLPGTLDEAQPLRYRVQSFLQYATGGTFWMLALLTLVFGVTTLTSEQRTRVIWQTVTKPVAPWKYLLGKWLGIITLQGVLLAVCATGIFLFVSYLRMQPAIGEREAFVATGADPVTEDRLILETQVLTATRRVDAVNPYDPADPEFLARVEEYIRSARISDPEFARDPAVREKVFSDLYKGLVQAYRSIDPIDEMGGVPFEFVGLRAARERGLPVTLRYRIEAGGNRPDQFYMLTFVLPNGKMITRRTGLGMNHTVSLSPEYISEDGSLRLQVYNGQIVDSPQGMGIAPNPTTFTFPPGGLQISYQASSYQANFVRVMGVLWLKLALLAMLAIWTSTFLSFSVASLVSLSIFFMAETAGFLTRSVELYSTTDHEGQTVLYKVVIAWISSRVADLFSVYANLDPVGRIVDGQLMSWSAVAWGTAVLAVITGLLYISGVAIFRRRELAIYSGVG